jgi:uncharacterized integral membrane protein
VNNGEPAPVDPQILVPPATASPGEVIRQQATSQDYVVLRLAVVGLIIATVFALAGTVLLSWYGKAAPDGVVAIGSAGVGALATMLVRPPQPPAVTNVIDRRSP